MTTILRRGERVDLFASTDMGHPLKLREQGRATIIAMFMRNWPEAVYSLSQWVGHAGEVRISSSGAAEYVSAVSHTGYAASEQEREET